MAIISDKKIYAGKKNPFDDVTKGALEFIKVADSIIAKGKELAKLTVGDINSNPKVLAEDYKKLSESITTVNKVNENTIKLEKQKAQLERELSKTQQQNIKTEQQKIKLTDQQVRANDKLVRSEQKQRKELEKQNSSYQKLNARLTEARKKAKDIGATYGTTSKQFKKAAGEVLNLDSKIKKIDKSLGLSQREVGNYASAFKGMGGAILAVTGGALSLRAFFNVMKQGVTVFAEFDKQVSKVAAISGASATDLKALRGQAELLGESTEKTASEVASLQLELAKLGFDPKQIQNATSSILDLSTAVDADLTQSATVAGSTLRAFGLDATETQRVTDVMALAFSRSSLDINKFQTAMASVAPVAKKFGFSVEDTTALLAQLTDAGFDASSAGTATRKILLNLADSGGELAQALGSPVENIEDLLTGLTKLNEEGTDLGKALELTDVKSVAAFSTFLEGVDSTRKLNKELNNARGSAQRMAEIMRDNLAGDTDKAKSAVQGLFINIGKRLNPALRQGTQEITGIVGKLNEWAKIKASEEIQKERLEVIGLVAQLQNADASYENRLLALNKLNEIAPDVVDGINAETVEYGKLNTQLDNYLEKVILRISLAKAEAEQQKALTDAADLYGDATMRLLNMQESLLKVSDKYRVTEGGLKEQIEGTIEALREKVKVQIEEGTAGQKNAVIYGKYIDTRTEEQKMLDSLSKDYNSINKIEKEANDIADESLKTITDKIKVLKEQLGITEKITDENEDNVTTTDDATDAVIRYAEAINELQSVTSKGVSVKYGEKFDLDKRSDNEKYQDKLFADNIAKSKKYNDELLDQTLIRNKTIEDLESEHYESLIGIFNNYRKRKIAADTSLSKEEIDIQLAQADQQSQAYSELANTLVSIGSQILDSRLAQIETELNATNQKISEQESLVDREFQLLKDGAANEYNVEKAKLEKLQIQREKDLAEKRKIQKQQQTIDTLSQISSLATAVANIIESATSELGWVGVVLGLAAAAAAVVGFSTYKGEAESAAYAEDGGTFIRNGAYIEKGNRHSRGGNKYNELNTEQGELHGILSRGATRKHGDFVENIINLANKDKLSNDDMGMYRYSLTSLQPNSVVIQNNYNELLEEMKGVRSILSDRKTPAYDKNGNLIIFDNYGMIKKRQV